MLKVLPAVFISVLGLSEARVFAEEARLSSKVNIYPSYRPDSGGNLFSGLAEPSERAEGKELICRSSSFDLPSFESTPGWKEVLNRTLLDEYLNRGDGPVTTSVTGVYIQFGLIVINGSGETLVIDTVSVTGRAVYNGQIFNHSTSLNSGYCGLPFFYVAADGEALTYHPLSDNPLENLTLYMGGFPVVDSLEEGQPVIVIPGYDMELTFMGWFFSEEKAVSKPFFKRLSVKTKAKRFVKTGEESPAGGAMWSHTVIE